MSVAAEDLQQFEDDIGGIVVVAFAFAAENEDELECDEGTRIRKLERRDEWWYAEKIDDSSKKGIIPMSYCVSEAAYTTMYDDEEENPDEGENTACEMTSETAIVPPPPPPDVAEAALAKVSEELDFETLSKQFENLQKRVASVKLTTESFPDRESHQQEIVAAVQQHKEIQSVIVPSPSPQATHQAIAPPPSPQQAMQQVVFQTPPPPSPDVARQQFSESQMKRMQDEAIESARIKKYEEESKKLAAQLYAQRQEEERARSVIRQKEEADRQTLRNFSHQKADKEVAGNAAMDSAINAVKEAIQADNNGQFSEAYTSYTQALELFADVLNKNVKQPQHAKIVERMLGYLDRMTAIEGMGVIAYKKRVSILSSMVRVGFDPTPFGDELKLKARFSESKNDLESAFKEYKRGLEYYMSIHTCLKERKRPIPKELVGKMTLMLDSAERLRVKLGK